MSATIALLRAAGGRRRSPTDRGSCDNQPPSLAKATLKVSALSSSPQYPAGPDSTSSFVMGDEKRRPSFALIRRLTDTLRMWRQREKERAELARMSLYELRDIGLSTSDRWREVNKPFWR
jgi:uncharacterized protein YjiS (DUF1127 family)